MTAYAIYGTFRISDECDGYLLTVGDYHGGMEDSLSYHNDSMFSTLDRENVAHPDFACAELCKGAWLYDSYYRSHLYGRYYNESLAGIDR